MSNTFPRYGSLARLAVILLPAGIILWPDLYLLLLIPEQFENFDALIFGVISAFGILVPLLWSANLRTFWLWNTPFALFAGCYGTYVHIFGQPPYSGIWATIWYTTWSEAVEQIAAHWPFLVAGTISVLLYLKCGNSKHNQAITLSARSRTLSLCGLSWVSLAVVGIPTVWAFPDIHYLKPVKEDLFYSSYPAGTVVQGAQFFTRVLSQRRVANFSVSYMPQSGREIYVHVIGESEQYYRWLDQARASKSPLLSNPNVVLFGNNISQSNFTHVSIPLLMTGTQNLAAAESSPIWLQYARSRGCKTAWFSANEFEGQREYKLPLDFEFDLHAVTRGMDREIYDDMLIPEIRRTLRQGPEKLCLVMHMGGSHTTYRLRYRPEQERYRVDSTALFSMRNKNHMEAARAAYSNTLLKNLAFVETVIAELEQQKNAHAFLVYAPDHGENIYDDGTSFMTHGRLKPSRYELRVPLLVWASAEFQRAHLAAWTRLVRNMAEPTTNRSIFPTLLASMGIAGAVNTGPSLFDAADRLRAVPRQFTVDGEKLLDFSDLRPVVEQELLGARATGSW
jgi:glucan phosphoethanolaminetransferase (alkaline phosphatase superfamily)